MPILLLLLALLGGGLGIAFFWQTLFAWIWTPVIISVIALWYVVARWDLLPDWIPGLGLLDDAAVVVLAGLAWLLHFGIKFEDWVQNTLGFKLNFWLAVVIVAVVFWLGQKLLMPPKGGRRR